MFSGLGHQRNDMLASRQLPGRNPGFNHSLSLGSLIRQTKMGDQGLFNHWLMSKLQLSLAFSEMVESIH